jgi:hypothetical protein
VKYKKFFKEENELDLVKSEINTDHLTNVEIIDQIIDFFKQNPYPVDDVFHNFVKSLGLDPDDIEPYVYAIASCFINGGNFNKSGKKIEDFDPEEISMGLVVEAEHIDSENQNPVIQKIADYFKLRVAADHLADNPFYYSEAKQGILKIEELK